MFALRSRFSLKYWMSLILQQFPSEALCFVLKESISDIIFQNKGNIWSAYLVSRAQAAENLIALQTTI